MAAVYIVILATVYVNIRTTNRQILRKNLVSIIVGHNYYVVVENGPSKGSSTTDTAVQYKTHS